MRIASVAIDELGQSFTTQKILSSVYWHMLVNRKKKWNISRSASTTKMVDLIAKKYNLQCFETPVGFKNIAQEMVKGNAQIGGEESGGIGFVDHIMERDGFTHWTYAFRNHGIHRKNSFTNLPTNF